MTTRKKRKCLCCDASVEMCKKEEQGNVYIDPVINKGCLDV